MPRSVPLGAPLLEPCKASGLAVPRKVPLGALLCDRFFFGTAGYGPATEQQGQYGAYQIKSTVLLGLGFFFTFTAWHSAQNLQSSLPLHAGVSGDTALGIVYSLLPLGYVLAPSIVRSVGLKAAIVVPMCMYSTFIAANMYPRWWTLYPAACNVGLACGPMFVSQNTLLTRLALSYAADNGLPPTSRVGMFQGIFMSIFMTTQLVGNTFYALLFRLLAGHRDAESSLGDGSEDTPAQSTIVLLFAIYTLFVLAGASLIGCGLHIPAVLPAEIEEENAKPGEMQQSPAAQGDEMPTRNISAVLKLLRARKMQALLPLVLSTGFMGSFVTADFTSQVVKPALGENNLGFIMAMVGGASVVANALCGRLSDSSGSTSRVAVFVVALVLNSAVSGLLYWWEPANNNESPWVSISLVGIAIGLSSAASQTMLYSHLSASWVGETDAAFACSNGLTGFAQCIGFFAAGSLPMHTMLIVGVPAQLVGGIGFCLSVAWANDK